MNRQESLFAILPRAVEAAKKASTEIAVLNAPCFVDEHDKGEHVYCPKEAVDVLYPVTPQFASMRKCDAMVNAEGAVFFAKVEDIAEHILRNAGRVTEIEFVEKPFHTFGECNHNEMVATGDKKHAWKCAACGYVYGEGGEA